MDLEQPPGTLVASDSSDRRLARSFAGRLVAWECRPLAIFRIAGWTSSCSKRRVSSPPWGKFSASGGLFIGGSIGFVLGLMNGLFTMSNRILDSSLQMIRNIPHLALIPLVIRWFGIGEQGKLFLIILGVFFPIYLNTMHGVRSTDPRLLEMGKVYGLSPWRLLTRIILPGALPSILVGLRYALGIMWLTLIVAETIASDSGIGFMVMNARDFLQFDVVMFGILLYALLGKAADTATRGLEQWLLRWNPNYRHA